MKMLKPMRMPRRRSGTANKPAAYRWLSLLLALGLAVSLPIRTHATDGEPEQDEQGYEVYYEDVHTEAKKETFDYSGI